MGGTPSRRQAPPALAWQVRHPPRGQAFLTEQLQRLGDGSYAAPSRLTVADYLDEWQRATAATVRPATAEKRATLIRSRIEPGIGQTRLQALSGARLNAFYAELAADGLSAGTIRNMHALLSRACHDAVRWGYLPRSPVELADPPRAPRSRATAWTASELARFLDYVREHDARHFRAVAPRRDHGDAARRAARARPGAASTSTARGSGSSSSSSRPAAAPASARRSRLARGGRSRSTPRPSTSLRRHREAQLLERDFAGDAYEDHDLVFADELGNPIHPQTLSRAFTRQRERPVSRPGRCTSCATPRRRWR